MLFQLGRKYNGYWESEFNPISVTFNEKIWKVVSVSDEKNEYFFSLFQKNDGSAFYITAEALDGEAVDSESIEEAIFAKLFNADNDATLVNRFSDKIGSLQFDFVSYSFTNRKFGTQLANYGYSIYGDILIILNLSWPDGLEVPGGSHWPIKHVALISGISLDY